MSEKKRTTPFYAELTSPYGNLRPGVSYKVKREMVDCYVFNDGTHVPKNLVAKPKPPKQKEYMSYDEIVRQENF